MKPVGLLSTAVLLFLLGTIAPTVAQQEQHEQEAKPPKHEKQAKPEKQQQNRGRQQGQRKQEQRAKGQQERQRQQQAEGQQRQQKEQRQQARGRQERQRQQQHANRPSQQEQHGQRGEHRAIWQQHRARSWEAEHRTWQQRGGYNGYRIPENRYRGYFGPNHWFRLYNYPVEVYGGYPRFQYRGFWFGLIDPWPEYWSDNWYERDDVYIVYFEDGYYLYNRRHPRDRIAITIYAH